MKPVVLFNYACHGVVMGPDNIDVSADWIGAARKTLEENPTIGTAMFLQGCCGNINPGYRGSFEEVKHAGEAVAAGSTKQSHTDKKSTDQGCMEDYRITIQSAA